MANNETVVSILCPTYNHVNYIKDAIDSFLSQKTNFKFEILINDDASNDGTSELIKKYLKRHPNIIRAVFHKENEYSKGKRGMIVRYLLPKAEGKYIALCEGDDYWTDPHKLQKQVDFLDKHRDYALCFHPVKAIYENNEDKGYVYPNEKNAAKFTLTELFKENYIQTNSVVYRRQNYENLVTNVMPGDWYLHVYHAQFGKIGFLREIMSIYRRHEGSVWWDSKKNRYKIWSKHGVTQLALFFEFLKMAGDKTEHIKAVELSMGAHIDNLIETDLRHDTKLLDEIARSYQKKLKQLMISQYRNSSEKEVLIKKKNRQIDELTKKLAEKQSAVERRDKKIVEMTQSIVNIKTSNSWKVASKLKKINNLISKGPAKK